MFLKYIASLLAIVTDCANGQQEYSLNVIYWSTCRSWSSWVWELASTMGPLVECSSGSLNVHNGWVSVPCMGRLALLQTFVEALNLLVGMAWSHVGLMVMSKNCWIWQHQIFFKFQSHLLHSSQLWALAASFSKNPFISAMNLGITMVCILAIWQFFSGTVIISFNFWWAYQSYQHWFSVT